METDIAVLILTKNEEKNIEKCLSSAAMLTDKVFVVDSFSTDNTREIVVKYGGIVECRAFDNFSSQRNFALEECPFDVNWLLFLDADETIEPGLAEEIKSLISLPSNINGFYVKRKLIWQKTWIRRGYYPSWQLRLVKKGFVVCEGRPVNEHLIVDGEIGQLEGCIVDENLNGLEAWLAKHIEYAKREALILSETASSYGKIKPNSQAGRRRFIRHHVYNKLPIFVRPFLYFVYRAIIRGGVLDGKVAFGFHFLQAFWYPMLIDIFFLIEKLKDGSKQQKIDIK